MFSCSLKRIIKKILPLMWYRYVVIGYKDKTIEADISPHIVVVNL